MKYGIFFMAVAGLLAFAALNSGGWYLLLGWPALSFGMVGVGYLRLGPGVFGKSSRGTLALANQLLLLPFLAVLWGVWNAARLIKAEPAFHQLTDDIFIGRRVFPKELPKQIDYVIDLTSEFNEPKAIRAGGYYSFPILDRAVPKVDELLVWVEVVAGLSGKLFIHCAEGHGRSALFAAALLIHCGHSKSPYAAVTFMQSKRPLVRLSKRQFSTLTQFALAIRPASSGADLE